MPKNARARLRSAMPMHRGHPTRLGRALHRVIASSPRMLGDPCLYSTAVNEHISEIDPPDVFVGYDFRGVTLCQNLTIVNDIGAVDQA